MAALKCIGGTNDGEYYEVGNLKYGDLFQIHQQVGAPVMLSLETIMPDKIDFKVSVYKITEIRCNNKQLIFMKPSDWTDERALEWQFSK